MDFKIKNFVTLCLAGMMILTLAPQLFARTVWVHGMVTKKLWNNKYQHIEVDKVKYTLMPKVVKFRAPGHKSLRDIEKGQNIWIRVQGHRIYEIFLEEKNRESRGHVTKSNINRSKCQNTQSE